MRTGLLALLPRAAALSALLSAVSVSCSRAGPVPATGGSPNTQVQLIADEADEAIRILDLRAGGVATPEEAWTRLFATEGYRNLRARELGMRRPFTDSGAETRFGEWFAIRPRCCPRTTQWRKASTCPPGIHA